MHIKIEGKKMTKKSTIKKIQPHKMLSAVTLILLISISSFAFFPPAQSQETNVKKTYIFVTAQPNPVGIGQTANVLFFLDKVPPLLSDGSISYENWKGITITVEKPDGTTETLGPFESQSQAAGYVPYVPTQTGNYTFQAHFPGQTLTVASTDTYGPSDSVKATLTVQEEQIPEYKNTPLPSQYWTRPIDAQNRDWYQISGNWLGLTRGESPNRRVNLYSNGPETAHIAWTKEISLGGLIGGEYKSDQYFAGLWYYPQAVAPIILNGRLYERTMSSPFQYKGTVCIDIRTGEELWNKDGVFASFGSVWFQEIGDIHGGIPYLWGTGAITDEGIVNAPATGWYENSVTSKTWHLYDANTGDLIRTFENASTGTPTLGPNGELLVYVLNTQNHWLARWNSSAITDFISMWTGMWQWTPQTGPPVDWNHGIDFNVTIGSDVPARYSISGITSDTIIARRTYTLSDADVIASDVAFDLETGNKLWGPTNRTKSGNMALIAFADGVYVNYEKMLFKLTAYDVKTGAILWTNQIDSNSMDFFGTSAVAAYGKLYTTHYGGHAYAFDLQTGERIWNYSPPSSGFETPSGKWELAGKTPIAADGKIYIPAGDTEPFRPYWRGYALICLDAENGTELWRSSAAMQTQTPGTQGLALADGYLVGTNMYDNRVYCYGKGPSATTVTAPDVGVTTLTPVTIRGTVLDLSAGTQQGAVKANFPYGVPAVSDASQSAWMEYVYMQQPKPTNTTGVPVAISVIDSNGNSRQIGTTTSNADGTFSLTWTPDISGAYTVTASFAGSESYYLSSAGTSFYASEAPTATAAPTQPPQSTADLYFVPAIAGLFVAIIAIGVVLALLMLRKKP